MNHSQEGSQPAAAALAINTGLGEEVWPDEEALTARISKAIQASIVERYPSDKRPALRDAHPKSHGCVHAEFRVDPDLPARLATGVFIPGTVYKAWIRFSNGDADATRADKKGDARGMAIKLTGVSGPKILDEERDATTQDFVLISNPTFFADDPAVYAKFIERATSSNLLKRLTAPIALGWKGLNIARRIAGLRIPSPLSTRYWSTVPSQLGGGPEHMVVKYSARPSSPTSPAMPDDPQPDYLRKAMVRALSTGDASFDFLVQPRAGAWMSVEDSRTEWSEADAPFFKVATIVIPRQLFDNVAQDRFGEDLSFTPWHSLPEHRPLGGVNRVRKVVYQAVSKLRHELNGRTRSEPTGDERFSG